MILPTWAIGPVGSCVPGPFDATILRGGSDRRNNRTGEGKKSDRAHYLRANPQKFYSFQTLSPFSGPAKGKKPLTTQGQKTPTFSQTLVRYRSFAKFRRYSYNLFAPPVSAHTKSSHLRPASLKSLIPLHLSHINGCNPHSP